MLPKRTHPLAASGLLAATLGFYGVCWLHALIKELHRRGATTLTPRVALTSLFVPVYNVIWSVLLVGELHNALIKAFVDAGRWPPRDLRPMWGFALVLPTLIAFLWMAPWLSLIAVFALLSLTISSAQGWLDDLAAIPVPLRHSAAADGPAVGHQDEVWLAYRPIGDQSPGVDVLDRGVRRLLARGQLSPDEFEVRAASGTWTTPTAFRARPADLRGFDLQPAQSMPHSV